MSESKRYYWIKLKIDFFENDAIDFLLSQNNGCEYVALYLKLCTMVANTDGALITRVGETCIPYDIKKIARDTKFFSENTIKVSLELFKNLGLIQLEQNYFKISNYENMIGSETEFAKKKRQYRKNEKIHQIEYKKRDNVRDNVRDKKGTMSDKSIEYRDIDNIEYRDIDNRDRYIGVINNTSTPKGCVRGNNNKPTLKNVIESYTKNEELRQALYDFIEMRKTSKKPLTVKALKLCLKTLDKLALDDFIKIDIVNQSIEHNWQTFYKNDENKKINKKKTDELPF